MLNCLNFRLIGFDITSDNRKLKEFYMALVELDQKDIISNTLIL
ncbi:MAG TPA: hypothetical protein VKX33_04355 [Cyclobacteriaceae bacterium]|nr:hypothetical protein [Cyclobacteriaceae bacterium]